ncbi:MAG: type I glyceraldehyde-3-phosphate dehydrogenase [Gammaproteobacteria bacterium]|nr:type I glyceraldehyde-3-phosphate dehydrogenase [Gammaproteobacteria bacterium]
MIKIAINGFGRIGRNIVRAIHENGYQDKFHVVAINDLAPTDINTHLLRFDTTHGRFNAQIENTDDSITVNSNSMAAFMQKDPQKLPWKELGVDIVFECTGFFRSRKKASMHLAAGAEKVLLSAPGKQFDSTIVYGVNQSILKSSDQLVSNASCTTNCLAHIAKAMHDAVGIEHGLANTIHAYTSTQNLVDSYHKDKRRARAAAYSMIPTTTGSAKAIGQVIPDLVGKLDAVSVRVPTLNVSLLDFTFVPTSPLNAEAVEKILRDYSVGREGVFDINKQPLVSIDMNHNVNSCIVDLDQTRVVGGLIKILAWYDNEWGFSNRMLDTALAMNAAGSGS